MIVVMYDVTNSSKNIFYIMNEKELIVDTQNFQEAIFLLFAAHYVFNLEYNAIIHDTLLFLQEFVFHLKFKEKHSAVYTSVTTRLFRESQKIMKRQSHDM